MRLNLFLAGLLFPFLAVAQFNNPQLLTVPAEPRHFADVDMDGDMDFLDDLNLSWAERNSDGNYFQNWPICYDPILGFADIDNDGDQDAYGFVISSGLFGWFENQNTHDVWAFHAVSDYAYSVAFDLNMDGLLDFTSITESDQNNAFYNLGGGNFSSALPLQFPIMNGLFNSAPYYGDFDNDGFQDIVKEACSPTSNGCLDGHYLEFYLSSANYALNGTPFMTTYARAVGDFNNDGLDDLVTVNYSDYSLYVIYEGVNSGFQNEVPLCCVQTNSDFQFADIDLDGAMDLIATDLNFEILIYLNDGIGNFPELPIAFAPGMQLQQATLLTFSDVDADYDLDAFYGTMFFENSGSGQFDFVHNLSIPGGTNWFFEDIDQNGTQEWIGAGGNVAFLDPQLGISEVMYDMFDGGAGYSWDGSWRQNLSDVNHDDVMDFIDFKLDNAYGFEYDGSSFHLITTSPLNSFFYNAAVIISDLHDFNNDGVNELILLDGNDGVSLYAIYIFDDLHVEGPLLIGSFSTYSNGADVIDIDMDGDEDFVSSSDYYNYLQNDGANQFIEVAFSNPNLASTISSTQPDLDGDGISDSFDGSSFLEGNGYGLPMLAHSFAYTISGRIYWVDYNSDGFPDLINHESVGNNYPFQNTIRVFINQGQFNFEEASVQNFESSLYLSLDRIINIDEDGDPDLLWYATSNSQENYYKGLFWSENVGDPLGIISGHVFYDENVDAIWTADETGIEMTQVTISPQGTTQFVDDFYFHYAGNGTYTIEVNYDEEIWIPTTPTIYTVTVDDLNMSYDQLNFGFVPANNDAAIEVSVMAFPSVCSGVQQYEIQVHNYTEANADVLVTMDFDSHLLYNYSSSIEYSWLDNQIQWLVTDIPYGTSQLIHAYFIYPDASFIETEMISNVSACLVDENMVSLMCDQEAWTEIASCAYDPNEKIVTPVGYTSMGFISNGTELEYTVRFQNTGNAPAQDVVVEDQLSAALDWTTLTPVAWSHPMHAEFSSTGLARFNFQDIMLPDSTSNEQNSHGFVRFKITPLTNLFGATEIHNSASIFFDLNEAVVTNEVLNTIFTCDMMGAIESIEYECGVNDITYDPGLQYVESFVWTVNDVAAGNEPILSLPFTTPTNLDVQLTAMNPLCETSFDFTLNLNNQIQNLTISQNGSVLQSPENAFWQYEWTLDGVLIEGETGSSLDMTAYGSGHYAVNITNNNGCSASYEGDFVTGISETNGRQQFRLFPNPASNQVYFKSESTTIKNVTVYTAGGLKLIDKSANSMSGVVDVSNLAPGIYYLQASTSWGETYYQLLSIAR